MLSNKARNINIRINDEEYSLIQAKADELHMKLSEYVRFACINAKVNVTTE